MLVARSGLLYAMSISTLLSALVKIGCGAGGGGGGGGISAGAGGLENPALPLDPEYPNTGVN